MAKKIQAVVKLQCPAGAANPAPPVGTALGPHGVNIMEFCKQFNARTQSQAGMVIPVVVTIFADRTFTFITKTPPAPNLLLKEAGLEKGSAAPNRTKVGRVTRAQVKKIAEIKMADLNAANLDSAMRGHSVARTMYGWNDEFKTVGGGNPNTVPFNGVGRVHTDGSGKPFMNNLNQDDFNLMVNSFRNAWSPRARSAAPGASSCPTPSRSAA